MVHFSIPNHDVAITCFIRRVRFFPAAPPASFAVVDTFCSQRTFDLNYICENEVGLDVAVQRGDVYYRPGYTSTYLGGPISPMRLEPVPVNSECEGGVVQVMATWDIVGACNCATLNKATGLVWLLQQKDIMTMFWTCDSLLLQSALVLWCLTVYLVWLQFGFLRHSVICCAPIYLSKNVIGPVILLLTFYGNHSLQTLGTFMYQNPSYTYTSYYQIVGPALVASIVGIMTGTLIQIWFNPRLVTQMCLLLVAVSFTRFWFCLEAFVVVQEQRRTEHMPPRDLQQLPFVQRASLPLLALAARLGQHRFGCYWLRVAILSPTGSYARDTSARNELDSQLLWHSGLCIGHHVDQELL